MGNALIKQAVVRVMLIGGEMEMNETIIILCALGTAAIACIVGLIVISVREKKMKKKPTYYSAIGNWLCGRRRWMK